MGNQNCSQIYQIKQQNQSYGDFKIVKELNKAYALIQKTLQNDSDLQEEVKTKLQTRLKLKSNHLVKLQKYEINCNKYSTQVQMYYEYINKTLEDKYHDKMQENLDFSERQLFNIIYGVEEALEELNRYEIRHGCINMLTVLCQGNFYKITDVSSTTCTNSNKLVVKSYDLARRGCRNQFLSQKLLTNLEYRSLEPYYEIDDDLFSLGMIILTLTSKLSPRQFYVWKQKNSTAELKWQKVESSIKRVEKVFSSKLSKKVKELIGFVQEADKSQDSNSTTANNAHNISNYQPNELVQITQSINTLDKDIDKILSRVNVHSSFNHKTNEEHSNSKNKGQNQEESVKFQLRAPPKNITVQNQWWQKLDRQNNNLNLKS